MRDVAPYRQPMITSLGIMMGFLLNFLANWAIADGANPALKNSADWVVAGTLVFALSMMCVVLYRLLDIRIPDAELTASYIITFRIYMAALVVAFAGLGFALLL